MNGNMRIFTVPKDIMSKFYLNPKPVVFKGHKQGITDLTWS